MFFYVFLKSRNIPRVWIRVSKQLDLKTKSIQLRDFIWSRPVPVNITCAKDTFIFRAVNEAEVLKELKKFKRKKATGLDNLAPGLLKYAAPVIAKPFTFIINLSLDTGIMFSYRMESG